MNITQLKYKLMALTLQQKNFCSVLANNSSYMQTPTRKQVKKFEMDRHLYLASQSYLELKYVTNHPSLKLKSNHISLHRGLDQHNDLVKTYKKILGGSHNISLLQAVDGQTILSFFGETIFYSGKKALFGRLASPEGEKEIDYSSKCFEEHEIQGTRVPENMTFEGSSETLQWRNKILIGYGQRNTKNVVQYVGDYFEKEVIGLELVDPFFYHLDMALFPISDNLIAVCEEAFSEQSMMTLRGLDCEILTISKEESMKFALNSVVFGNDVVVYSKAKQFISLLENRGYRVHAVDISEFIKFGGGIKCLTFQHYL